MNDGGVAKSHVLLEGSTIKVLLQTIHTVIYVVEPYLQKETLHCSHTRCIYCDHEH